jgi:hypothetical protein
MPENAGKGFGSSAALVKVSQLFRPGTPRLGKPFYQPRASGLLLYSPLAEKKTITAQRAYE